MWCCILPQMKAIYNHSKYYERLGYLDIGNIHNKSVKPKNSALNFV